MTRYYNKNSNSICWLVTIGGVDMNAGSFETKRDFSKSIDAVSGEVYYFDYTR